VALDDIWKKGPYAYLAISVRDMPNFFMLNGPNSPVGNFSLIEVAELQVGYILRLIEAAQSGGHREVSVSAEAMERFDQERRVAAKRTIWATGCKSWYLDHEGLPTAWPWKFDRFRDEMSEPQLADFDMQ
jgi:cation diffusion facilitator CzcD-associated flavoprotein CzcO